jgi:aminoglycoside phosphotransferase family enzyme
MTCADDGRRSAVGATGVRDEAFAPVAALRMPAAYPDGVRSVEVIETHMSWVFLTHAHAYKLKKPARTQTLEDRRRACETELQLNRRLAPSVYLGVVPLVVADGILRLEARGEPIDWLVKMRRLARVDMLDTRIRHDAVEPAEIDRLAAVLDRFYAGAQPAGSSGPGYRRRLAEDIAAKRRSLEQPRYGLPLEGIRALSERLRRGLTRHAAELEKRAGAVVDAHGDLRPEHVCLELEPVVIDCLEFDRELRLLDPLSELCFLALECRRLGAGWIGERLLERHLASTGEHASAVLIPFYQSYHAMVRAAVAIWHLDDHALDHTEAWRQRSRAYLRLGCAATHRAR